MICAVPATAQPSGERGCPGSFDANKVKTWHQQTPCLEAKVREQVEVIRDPSLFKNGQGFYVGDGSYVLTAAHVLGGCQYFSVTDGYGRQQEAGLVNWDARRDVAVLRPAHGGTFGVPNRGGGFKLATVSRGVPIGVVNIATIELIGNRVSPPRTTPRSASAPDAVPIGPDNSIVLEGAALELGASGAPVLNSDGEVVGMVTANIQLSTGAGTDRYTIATPASELRSVLLNAGGDNRVRPPTEPTGSYRGDDLAGNLVKVRCR